MATSAAQAFFNPEEIFGSDPIFTNWEVQTDNPNTTVQRAQALKKSGDELAHREYDAKTSESVTFTAKSDEAIMAAQEAGTNIDSDFVILTDVTAELSVNPVYLNPKEFGPHYNNAGLKIIGEAAAEKLTKISELTGGNRL